MKAVMMQADKKERQEVPPGYKRTEVGVIPEEWELESIGALSTIKTGSRNTQDRIADGAYPFFVRSQHVERIGSYSYEGEAVLTAGDGVGTGKIFHYINGRFDVHQRVYRITEFSTQLDGKYFFYQFSSRFYDRIMSMTAKSSVDSVRMDMISNMKIPLPSPSEQRAIATALSDADALIESLDRLIEKKRAIKQGAMQQLLTGKKRLPGFKADWKVQAFNDLCAKIQDGTHFSPKTGGGVYPYITSRNIGYGKLNLDGVETVGEEEHRKIYARCDTRKGDLLLTKDGAKTGNAAINEIEGECSLLSSVAFLRFDSSHHISEFFLQCILSSQGQQKIKNLMSGNAITRLTLQKIRTLRMPVPPLPEQRAIASILSDMDAEIEVLERRRAKMAAVKKGMMQVLLTGKVRLVEPEGSA